MVVEDLHTKGMTDSARGTAELRGQNFNAEAGLNRAFPVSN